MAVPAILSAIFGKKTGEKSHLHTQILCTKFGYERPDCLGGVTGQMDKSKSISPSAPMDPLQLVTVWE